VTVPLKSVLESLISGRSLTEADAFELLVMLTDPSVPPAQAGAILATLRAKGTTADELRGFARGMRSLARRPDLPAVGATLDMVGTGGDGSNSFNLSTGSALLATAAGLTLVKHGNRSVSSRSGSADLLEALGLRMPLDPEEAAACLSATGFTFLFAPHYHPAMKALAPVRAALGIRTVFNLLGPLTNPAAPAFQIVGAYDRDAARLLADALAGMPIERAFVVHGEPGWDEPTPAGPFLLHDVTPGRVTTTQRCAEDYGLPACQPEELTGGDAAENARALRAVFEGQDRGAHRAALVMGAALALEVTGTESDPRRAARRAEAVIDDGSARRLLERLATFGKALS
jgi:anthranilate phosphoribosyltransferase